MHETKRQNNILDLIISTEEELIVNLKITDKIGDHRVIPFSIKTENEIQHQKKNTTLEEQILMQCGLNLITKPLNNQLSEIMPSSDVKFSRTESMMQAEDIPKRRATISNPSWINNDVKEAIGRRQRAYETKRRINYEETIPELIAATREFEWIVKQDRRNKELSIARICKHNFKRASSLISTKEEQ